ncbi:hypothetical protein M409DRAFT_22409 [Zasmidium cellare ATCC 36951]|uniref:Uncharacterized protein n=1 Tax=Zasmidium cellare ATCC 36951 TaxID=1080233 RepID=A0A6A6CK41_ZASCE|nr:uncharacterized protein M409DRAFT_22409 [Zasmidium cellare ATCC 36951]KAF2167607.1 hypothetical protein M409DRAFT_22409 [Zasmidium cellare ATCC 36951]
MGLFNDPSQFPLATLIIIAASGLAVMLGYAHHRLFYGIEDTSIPGPSDDQTVYMREQTAYERLECSAVSDVKTMKPQ